MNKVIISFSPRKGGNCDAIADMAGKEFGCKVIYARDLSFAPCNGCEACSKTGKCKYNDDATVLLSTVRAADKVIFVAPLYFCGFDSHSKAFIDRAQVYWGQKAAEEDKKSQLYAVFCGGQDAENNVQGAYLTLRSFSIALDCDLQGYFYIPRVDAKGEVLHSPLLSQAIENIGKFLW